ncbi:hypothetical protein GCM10027160_07030 [Streptomyces calidiresistens]|uniref:Uncharacterized protein n=1 Tax=Streptomyces calidiresistens TaxID=1485586 RepID=A0A7W3T0A6_9ACTN|nr:hypothetical protein [Streptomyces calidiresistens]MBB0228557.1 hypothetical protein [Streptomyces calidiresistens]
MKFSLGEFRTEITRLTRSIVALAYRSATDLPSLHLRFLSRQLAERRRQVDIPRRRLPPKT